MVETTRLSDSDLDHEEDDIFPPGNCMLKFEDTEHPKGFLARLNTLRKDGQFYDLTLEIEGNEIQTHKCVMAGCSQHLYEILTAQQQDSMTPITHCKLKGIDFDIFQKLVDYAYTAELEVPEKDVKAVYKVAQQLKMGRIAEACSQFLSNHLIPENCLGIRSFANSNSDIAMTTKTDKYIQQNFGEVCNKNEFTQLPRMQVEILTGNDKQLNNSTKHHVCQLVVDWVQRSIESGISCISALTDHVSLLYLDTDNTVRDCQEVTQRHDLHQEEIVQDYKKNCKNRQVPVIKTVKKNLPNMLPKHLRSSSEDLVQESEWKLIASDRTTDKSSMCVAVIDSNLSAICIHFRSCERSISPTENAVQINGNQASPDRMSPELIEKSASLTPIAPMNSPRCGVGLAVLENQLIAMGGYDRGECLKTVETYNILTNQWKPHSHMTTPRGRFDASQIGGRLYAVGGSNGTHDLCSVEVYDNDLQTWTAVADMLAARSSPGAAVLNDKLYCVGGWSGQTSIVDCEVYDPNTDTWTGIAPLNIARSQAAICTFEGKLYAIGGCTSWNCINSVEVYSAKDDIWTVINPINVSRRGAGCVVFGGKLYLVGGSDGSTSLATVEVYNPDFGTWSFGPCLKTCRANVGVAVIDNKLFAVGGFSGKIFLDSAEFLDLDLNEWWGYMPTETQYNNASESSTKPTKTQNGGTIEKSRQQKCLTNGHHTENIAGGQL